MDQRCPSCQSHFTCNRDDIADCQCSKIDLTADIRLRLHEQFDGCLCLDCLARMAKGEAGPYTVQPEFDSALSPAQTNADQQRDY